MSEKNNYEYILLGGNHSFCARKILSDKYPENNELQSIETHVCVGLSVEQQRQLAWQDNVDGETRKNMSIAEKVIYIHNRYLEEGRPGADGEGKKVPGARKDFKRLIANEIMLPKWGINSDDAVLQAQDNLFQLAYREGAVWDLVERICRMHEKGELKDQGVKRKKEKVPKKAQSKPGYKEAPESLEIPEMKIGEWQKMQGIADDRILIPLLTRVAACEISLSFACDEFDRHKLSEKVRVAFYVQFEVENWDELVKDFGYWINEETIRRFHNEFRKFVSFLCQYFHLA